MIPDEIRQRFAAVTLTRNPPAFIVGIMPLLPLRAIGRVLRGEPRMIAYAQVDLTGRISDATTYARSGKDSSSTNPHFSAVYVPLEKTGSNIKSTSTNLTES